MKIKAIFPFLINLPKKIWQKDKKLPSFSQWIRILKILNKKEKIFFSLSIFLFLGSVLFLSLNFYFKNTEIRPVFGGQYIEGVVGQPRFINPIYAQTSDIDQALVELVFSGLLRYDQNGEIIPDLAKEYEIKEGGKVYEFHLKENIFWHNGQPLLADDIIFTIETVQNSDYKSPVRVNWLGVTVEKISDFGVRFELKNPYFPFLEIATLKILPKHVWQDIPPQSFPLSVFNLKPIGSGPYKLVELDQIKTGEISSLSLKRNPKYFDLKPNVDKIDFLFFETEEELIGTAQKGKIKGFSLISEIKKLQNFNSGFEGYDIVLPRYFAIFFNPQKSKVLSEKEIRKALNYGTNKEEIIQEALFKEVKIINSPILPEIYEFDQPSKIYQFDVEKAKEILEKAGFLENEEGLRIKTIKKEPSFQFKSDLKSGSSGSEVTELQKCLAKDHEVYPDGQITGYFGEKTKTAVINFQEKYASEILTPWRFKSGTGLVGKTTRTKLNEVCFSAPEELLPLKFSLITVDQPTLIKIANLLKDQWRVLGVEVEVKSFPISELEKEIIKKRDYDALLFGEVLGSIPDPFPFWHSSQKRDPGLNLALYENKDVDTLLEKARASQDLDARKEYLQEFQEILIEDAPAVFLYSPDYLYFVSKEIKGINMKMIVDPSKRFSEIKSWYVKTRRTLK
ncbi:ABC transporter substrate-binding protein [Patescibacteria group bacterium]